MLQNDEARHGQQLIGLMQGRRTLPSVKGGGIGKDSLEGGKGLWTSHNTTRDLPVCGE